MKRRKARKDTGRRPVRGYVGSKAFLADLHRDPKYLALKEQLGEVLTPSERAVLDAARGIAPPQPASPTEGGEP